MWLRPRGIVGLHHALRVQLAACKWLFWTFAQYLVLRYSASQKQIAPPRNVTEEKNDLMIVLVALASNPHAQNLLFLEC